MSGSVSLAPTNDRHDADRLIRFAVLSRIEILHILLEHSYDSQRKRERGPSQDGEPRQRLLIRRFTQLWWEALPEVGMCRVNQHHARHLAGISKPRQPTYPLSSRRAAGSGRPAALQSAAGRARALGRRPARTPAAGRPAPGRSAAPGHGRLSTPNIPLSTQGGQKPNTWAGVAEGRLAIKITGPSL
jgi:hypothetical protein